MSAATIRWAALALGLVLFVATLAYLDIPTAAATLRRLGSPSRSRLRSAGCGIWPEHGPGRRAFRIGTRSASPTLRESASRRKRSAT